MNTADQALESIQNQAEDWLLTLQGGEFSEHERHRFRSWLNADPRHQQCFERLLVQWNRVPELIDSPAHVRMRQSLRDRAPARILHLALARLCKSPGSLYTRYSPLKLSALAASVVMVALLALFNLTLKEAPTQRWQSAKGEVINIALDDGSRIVLSADSTLETRFSAQRREVALLGGQAYFSVAKDASRPFFVHAGDTRIRVVGTRFDVNRSARHLRVAVSEGVVEVSKPVTQAAANHQVSTTQVTLTQGQMVLAGHRQQDDLGPVLSIALEDVSPWQSGRLRYDGATLAEIAADANRFYTHSISLADESLGALTVTAAFHVSEIEQTLDDLATILPIRIHKDANRNIVIAPAPQSL